jgi:hypothetical protein
MLWFQLPRTALKRENAFARNVHRNAAICPLTDQGGGSGEALSMTAAGGKYATSEQRIVPYCQLLI